MTVDFFKDGFKALTNYDHMPWQRKLFDCFVADRFLPSIPIPTGLGKTCILAIWLLALARRALDGKVEGFPRRLAYVVNRRTVVDQATVEAKKLRASLEKPELAEIAEALRRLAADSYVDSVLAISTLRGEFSDNGEWRTDPARPAIIVGTVDMIGSRLLFSGYGRCGFKSKPLHAGLLGQDTLLVHDEAHLEPAFQQLLETLAAEQRRGKASQDARPLRIMALSATVRGGETNEQEFGRIEPIFGKDDEDNETAGKRLRALKWLDFHPVGSEKELATNVANKALELQESGQAILVFLRRVEDVLIVAKRLNDEEQQFATLTGTQRGRERDQLAEENGVFMRFLPPKDRRMAEARIPAGTVYLVCTSAGEVGVNLSADRLVCDLTPLDSMAQRFGRVNRFGEGEARIEVVVVQGATAPDASVTGKQETKPYDHLACQQTLAFLQSLPEGADATGRAGRSTSPAEIGRKLTALSPEQRKAAFTPEPVILPATDILFDAWALTTVRGKLPGRPPVADWLHGLPGWEPPETHVAWREEVAEITGDLLKLHPPEELLEDYPLKPHEWLRDRSKRVFDELAKIAERGSDLPVWVLDQDDNLRIATLSELVSGDSKVVEHCTVILPPRAGGLSNNGLLDGGQAWSEADDSVLLDVADEWRDDKEQPRRCRVWGESYRPPGMRLVRRIELPVEARAEDEDEPEIRTWNWYVRPRDADDDGSRVARMAQGLADHLKCTESYAKKLVKALILPDTLARAVVLAARWHDLGKNRRVWQRSIGNPDVNTILAKSGPGMRPAENLTRYRHEFGSLLDVTAEAEFNALDSEHQELVMHLIAAHHGRARPHFPAMEAFDPERPRDKTETVVTAVSQRFARSQQRYGRWGLAWLESLVRAADAMASNAILEAGQGSEK